jgi:hypothetical protein
VDDLETLTYEKEWVGGAGEPTPPGKCLPRSLTCAWLQGCPQPFERGAQALATSAALADLLLPDGCTPDPRIREAFVGSRCGRQRRTSTSRNSGSLEPLFAKPRLTRYAAMTMVANSHARSADNASLK